MAGFLIYATWIALCSVLPPTASDELLYHLEVPRQILHAGGFVLFRDNVYAYFPQLGEMLFLFGLAVSGELAAKLFHCLSGVLLAVGLYGFCRTYLSRRLSILSVAIFLSAPSVMVIFPWAYVDLTFCLFAFLTLAALVEFFRTGHWKWTFLAGVMAGAACATKYTGMQLLLLVVLFALVEHLWAKRGGFPTAAAALLGAALPLAILYPWRNFHLTGWPLLPFNFGGFQLHSEINWDADRMRLCLRWLSSFGTVAGQQSIWNSLLAPLLVFIAATFKQPRFYDGMVGPVFLLAPVLLARERTKPREVKLLMMFCLCFLLYWAFTTRQVRFLLPILPILSFFVALGLASSGKRLISATVAVLLAINIGLGIKQVWELHPIRFWLGQEPGEIYLARQLDVYSIYQEANARLGPDDQLYMVDMRNYGYYLNCRWRADFIFEDYQLGRCLEAASTPADVLAFFHSMNVTHLLINESVVTDPAWGFKPNQLAILKEFVAQRTNLLARDPRGHALYQLRY